MCDDSLSLKLAWGGLASLKDAEACEAFFKDKDTSKYALVLQQTLDSIRANAQWIEVCVSHSSLGC
jgi:aminopeptidase 2